MEPSGTVIGVFSTGRSGSTWLGSIFNTHPLVAYRFEPFHRLRRSNPKIKQCIEAIKEERFTDADLPRLYDALLPAHPLAEKPPFFQKDNCRTLGRQPAWAVARRLGVFAGAFGRLYTPKGKPPVVFKEITMESAMASLLKHTSIPVVYLVRHPCATVDSAVTGQQQKMMPTGRHDVLESLLKKHDPALADRFVPRLDSMDAVDKTALLWRIEVEQGIAAVQQSDRAMTLIYENLCRDSLGWSRKAFEHVGLEFHSQTQYFLEQLQNLADNGQKNRKKDFMNSYFTVMRNPRKTMDRWKTRMPTEDQRRVLKLVEGSPAFEVCAELGAWS